MLTLVVIWLAGKFCRSSRSNRSHLANMRWACSATAAYDLCAGGEPFLGQRAEGGRVG